MGLWDLTLQAIGFRVLTLLVIAGIHGGVIAAVAVLLGDKGPRYDGRLTALPTAHIDLIGAVGVILLGNGWTKPVAVDAGQFGIGRAGVVAVVLAGFTALLAMAVLFDALTVPALTTLPDTAGLAAAAFMRSASSLSIWIALFSLVPIPPLTGGLLLGAFGVSVPQRVQWIISVVLLAAVATGVVRALLGPAHAFLAALIARV